jgi:predicted DNA-binding transcriptional regulator YafY
LHNLELSSSKQVKVIYTNWRGETAERTIEPIKIWFGSTDWHKEDQWLLRALDIDKQAERDFALKDIQAWLN